MSNATTEHSPKKSSKKQQPPKASPEAAESTAMVPRAGTNLPSMGTKDALDAWGVGPLTSRDTVVPKILAMQAMSQAVTAGDAKMGEFRDSLNQEVIGGLDKPIEFIPFFMEKVYVVLKEEKGSYKFNRQVPITAENENQDFEVACKDGNEKWYRTQNFYVLLPQEVKDGTSIPYLLAFRSTSARAGQKLATTMFMKNMKAGKTPASTIMELSGAKKSNDKGTFIVMDVKEKRAASESEITEAFSWVQVVKAGRVKVDHSDLEREVRPGEAMETVSGAESTEY